MNYINLTHDVLKRHWDEWVVLLPWGEYTFISKFDSDPDTPIVQISVGELTAVYVDALDEYMGDEFRHNEMQWADDMGVWAVEEHIKEVCNYETE